MIFRPIPKPSPRKRLSATEKIAACLVHMTHEGEPMVPGAENMTAKEIVSSVQFHHKRARDLMGSDHPTNIIPQPKDFHIKVQTPIDRKVIDKARRSRKAEEAFRNRLLARAEGEDPNRVKKRHWPSRGFQKRKNTARGDRR